MISRMSFDERFKRMCLLNRTVNPDEATLKAYYEKVQFQNYADYAYACLRLEENGDKITLATLFRYIYDSKHIFKNATNEHRKGTITLVQTCNHNCVDCTVINDDNITCGTLQSALLFYTHKILDHKLTIHDADTQLRRDFPKVYFPWPDSELEPA